MKVLRWLLLLVLTGGVRGYTVDGDISDWHVNLDVSGTHFVNASFIPNPVGFIDYNYDNWDTGGGYPSGGELYDFEAIYFDNTADAVYVGLISSLPKDNYYFNSIKIHIGDSVYILGKDQLVQGNLGIEDEGKPNYFIEGSIPLSDLGNPPWGTAVYVEAVQTCGNDHIDLDGTIDLPNHAPDLTVPGPQTVYEGDTLSFNINAWDIDGDNITIIAQNVPNNATFQDQGNGTGNVYFTPDFCQAGVYWVTFVAYDDGSPSLSDTDSVQITVIDVNRAPIISDPGDFTVNEGDTIEFTVIANDPDTCDGDIVNITAENMVGASSFIPTPGNPANGVFSWETDYNDAGVYYVRFIATDTHNGNEHLSDTVEVQITVLNVNQPPVISVPPDQYVNEMDTLCFDISATDPDGDSVFFTLVTSPPDSSFVDNGDGTASFCFFPDYCSDSLYYAMFIVTDNGSPPLSDTGTVAIHVINVNRPPTIFVAEDSFAIYPDSSFHIDISASDLDVIECGDDSVLIDVIGLPSGATFWDHGNGTANMLWTPECADTGIYNICFYAYDLYGGADTTCIVINVMINQPPVVTAPDTLAVNENEPLSFCVSIFDPEGDSLGFTVEGLPSWLTLADTCVSGTPTFCDSGTYILRFMASDYECPPHTDTAEVYVLVNDVNQRPTVSDPGSQTVNEGEELTFDVTGTDPDTCDNDIVTLSASGLPSGSNFDQTSGNPANGTFSWTPGYDDAGVYYVTFIATDNHNPILADTVEVQITVLNVNRPPELTVPGPQEVYEGAYLQFGVSATDPDSDAITLTALNLPDNSNFSDNGDGTGAFDFSPDYCQAGVYWVKFVATDNGNPSLSDTDSVQITVINVNRAPEISATPLYITIDPSLSETAFVSINATDLDVSQCGDDALTLSYYFGAPPSHSTPDFVDNGNGTGTFTWVPDVQDIGIYDVYFVVTDNFGASDTVLVTIDVYTPGCPGVSERFNFQLKKVWTAPGAQQVEYPVYITVRDSTDSIGAYEILLAWDPSCMTLTNIIEAPEIYPYGGGAESEYFDYNFYDPGVVDPWPAVRIVMIRDLANNIYTPPLRGPICQVPILKLIFNMNYDWDVNYGCDVKFVVNECSDNTISDYSGLNLYDNSAIYIVQPNCDTTIIQTGLCPDNIEKSIILWDGDIVEDSLDTLCLGGDLWFSGDSLLLTGDVNLNTVGYEVSDAVFFSSRLLGQEWPPGWDQIKIAASTLNSDVNHNSVGWEVGDLALMTAIISGYAEPTIYEPTVAGKAYITFPDYATDVAECKVSSDAEIGAAYFILQVEGKVSEPVAGDIGGMNFGSAILPDKKEIRVLVFSLEANVIEPGEFTIFSVPVLLNNMHTYLDGPGLDENQLRGARFTLKKVELCDRMGNPIQVYWNGEAIPLPGGDRLSKMRKKRSGIQESSLGITGIKQLKVIPNPVKKDAWIFLSIGKTQDIFMGIYNSSGRLVRKIYEGKLASGTHNFNWNGDDDLERLLPNDVYFLRVKTEKEVFVKKVVILR